jgi:hypothetical protein
LEATYYKHRQHYLYILGCGPTINFENVILSSGSCKVVY